MPESLQQFEKELVHLVVAGSVDDGKSTFIGRLLYDTGNVPEDQVAAVKKMDQVEGSLDFSLFTDGLSAEREQKITIDVAYRYFSTSKRRFIVADVPGHEQYTRNMVTGASRAQIALLIVDARHGLQKQTKRHLFLAGLLGVGHLAVLINKMDAVNFDEKVFATLVADISAFAAKIKLPDLQYIPVSALKGEMVAERGTSMPWYQGRTVLDYLNHVELAGDRNLIDFRLPVQYVVRPHQDFRGYAGQIASGTITVGEPVASMPSGQETTIKEIFIGDTSVQTAFAPQSAVVTFTDMVDASRGNLIVRTSNRPQVSTQLEALMVWFSQTPLDVKRRYRLKHTTLETPCTIDRLRYAIDIATLHRTPSETLNINDIGRVSIQTLQPLSFDPYSVNRVTGACIIIDEATGETVGAAMIQQKGELAAKASSSSLGQSAGGVVWFTGLSGAGKSTIADQVYRELVSRGVRAERLDGDQLRSEVTGSLGFSEQDRQLNIAIAGYAARLLAKHGVIVLASFVSPFRADRDHLRSSIDHFAEVYLSAPLSVCEQRDVKGLYKQARRGGIENFTGVTHPYEPPTSPELILPTDQQTVDESVQAVLSFLTDKAWC